MILSEIHAHSLLPYPRSSANAGNVEDPPPVLGLIQGTTPTPGLIPDIPPRLLGLIPDVPPIPRTDPRHTPNPSPGTDPRPNLAQLRRQTGTRPSLGLVPSPK